GESRGAGGERHRLSEEGGLAAAGQIEVDPHYLAFLQQLLEHGEASNRWHEVLTSLADALPPARDTPSPVVGGRRLEEPWTGDRIRTSTAGCDDGHRIEDRAEMAGAEQQVAAAGEGLVEASARRIVHRGRVPRLPEERLVHFTLDQRPPGHGLALPGALRARENRTHHRQCPVALRRVSLPQRPPTGDGPVDGEPPRQDAVGQRGCLDTNPQGRGRHPRGRQPALGIGQGAHEIRRPLCVRIRRHSNPSYKASVLTKSNPPPTPSPPQTIARLG